ncbi:unnamed protein product [Mytilus coruscus]|uniref:Tyr recombinase domain-containing protein n=1 Tax=Mytilus coruscus TaxID=42192 RepID=A0A6J8DZT4_MYTCO|nr:unnamed protein product [Mytilus coruscus]
MEEPADCGMNVAEIDFLDVDMVDDVDDLTLSQVCQNVENEYFAFEGLQNLTLNQTLQNYQQGERCIADFFKVHLDALANDGNFYRRPLKGIPGTPIRYGNQPLGINKLKSFMKVICTKAGLSGYFTNHSCKRTCATQLYNTGVDEQEIMARTGHRSQAGVRKYKRTSAEISGTVSRILDPPCSSSSIEDSAESSVAPQKKLRTDGMEEDISDKRCENSNSGQIFHGCLLSCLNMEKNQIKINSIK